MQLFNACFLKVKTDCFKFISLQETKNEKFKNKDRMIRSFLIPVCFWIAKKTKKKERKFGICTMIFKPTYTMS